MPRQEDTKHYGRGTPYSGPDPKKEEARRKIMRALHWQKQLRRQTKTPLSKIEPQNVEERENIAILLGLLERAKELPSKR